MGALVFLGLLGAVAIAAGTSSSSRGGSRSSRSSRTGSGSGSGSSTSSQQGWSMATPIEQLDPHQAALRTGWTNTQQGAVQARGVISSWLGAQGRTAINAGTFAHELQQLHQDALADFAIDTWNTLHAPNAPPPSSDGGDPLALNPLMAAASVGERSSQQANDQFIAQWLAHPGRTPIEAGQFIHQLQTLNLNTYAEYAMDVWNERPTA